MFIYYKMFILNDTLSYSFIHFNNENNCEKRSFFYQKKKSFYNFVRQKYIVPLVKNEMFQKILIRFVQIICTWILASKFLICICLF